MLRCVHLLMALVGWWGAQARWCARGLRVGLHTAGVRRSSVSTSRLTRPRLPQRPSSCCMRESPAVFDHYIWKPFKAGDLHGFLNAFTIAKAALAAVFVYHEVKLMVTDGTASKLLSFLATPITAVVVKLESQQELRDQGDHALAVGGLS